MMPFGGRTRVLGVDLRDDQGDIGIHSPGRGVVHHDRTGRRNPRRGGQRRSLAVGEQGQVQAVEVCTVGVLDENVLSPPGQRRASRASGGEVADVGDREVPLVEQSAHHRTDLSGGSENSDPHVASLNPRLRPAGFVTDAWMIGAVDEVALGSGIDRRRATWEILLVLGVSLGQSAVYSLLRIVERLTRNVPLAQQTSTLNPSATPDRPWLDLAYQLVGIAFALVPALLALYLLQLSDPPAGERIGLDLRRPGFDAGRGLLLAVAIGVPGLALYAGARGLGWNTKVEASGLGDNWWTIPVLILSAAQNAVVEEVIMIGYLFTRFGQLGWRLPVGDRRERRRPRGLPPLPGLRWPARQSDHGRGLRPGLPSLEADRPAGRRAHSARHCRLRRVRRAGPPPLLALRREISRRVTRL